MKISNIDLVHLDRIEHYLKSKLAEIESVRQTNAFKNGKTGAVFFKEYSCPLKALQEFSKVFEADLESMGYKPQNQDNALLDALRPILEAFAKEQHEKSLIQLDLSKKPR